MTEKRSRTQPQNTRIYMENVMQRVFRRNVPDHLAKLLSGDRETLEKCAEFLSKNLDFHQLLHTLCLITGQRFDLEERDQAKAADAWVCWWQENKERLAWSAENERWAIPT